MSDIDSWYYIRNGKEVYGGKTNRDMAFVYITEGDNCIKNNELSKADFILQRSLFLLGLEKENKITAIIFMKLSWIGLKLEMYDGVIQLSTSVIHMKPNIQAFYNRGLAYIQTGNVEEAEKDFKKVLEIDLDNKEAKKMLVIMKLPKEVRERKGLELWYYEILEDIKVVGGVDKDIALINEKKGDYYFKNQLYKRSMLYYESCLCLLPQDDENILASIYLKLCLIELKLENYYVARSYATCVLRIKKTPIAFYSRGIAYMNIGELGEAENDFKEVLKIDPEHEDAKEQLKMINSNPTEILENGVGDCYYKSKSGQFRTLNNEIIVTYTMEADSFLQQNLYIEAKELYYLVLKLLEKKDIEIYLKLLFISINLDQREDAIYFADRVLRLETIVNVIIVRGFFYKWVGDLNASERDFAQVLEIDPDNKEVQDIISMMTKLQGDYKKRECQELLQKYINNTIQSYKVDKTNHLIYANYLPTICK